MLKSVRLAKFLMLPVAGFLLTACHGDNHQSLTQDEPVEEISHTLELDREWASHFAGLALRCVKQEYPNKPGHVMNDPGEVQNPASLHPAFYGCFDWHSSVHGHWMLVRLLKLFRGLPDAQEIRAVLHENLSAENIRTEVAYLDQPNRRSFERTYGWAWLLKLSEELYGWDDPDGKRWTENLEPLTAAIIERYIDFLPRQTYPIRRGVHPNTAFGIAFALDYARISKQTELENLLIEQSMTYYGDDLECPLDWEPDGDDFFSGCLMEADLMRRVLTPDAFAIWFGQFLPYPGSGKWDEILAPALVTDRSDPKIVHLDGLNLSRAWCMKGIASALPAKDPVRKILLASARRHAEATLPHVASGDYAGEHWLGTFAVYMLSLDDMEEK